MAKWSINDWNLKTDKTLTVERTGKQGILYTYILPYGANPMNYYEEAIDVKSRKKEGSNWRSKRTNQVYRPGVYQPIGDKRYFTFYQMQKMTKRKDWENFLEDLIRRQDDLLVQKVKEALERVMFND